MEVLSMSLKPKHVRPELLELQNSANSDEQQNIQIQLSIGWNKL
jgi:hypothetical protein